MTEKKTTIYIQKEHESSDVRIPHWNKHVLYPEEIWAGD